MVPTGPACPFCDSPATEVVSLWGGSMLTSQHRCLRCGSYFESIRRRGRAAEAGDA